MTNALERARALEEACDFGGAADAALEAGDARDAARLAALAGDEARFERAAEALATAGLDALSQAAQALISRGQSRLGGELFYRAGLWNEAAEALATSGGAVRAADALERAGRPADAARALERAIERDGGDVERLALARLCARHGRVEAAVRAVQAMRPSPERDAALPLLARSLRALHLDEAAREVDVEIRERGLEGGAQPEPDAPPTSAREVILGRFEVSREVARTPHARVLEATDRMTSRPVALKILRGASVGAGRDALARFEREARALARIAHPHVVPLLDYLPLGPAIVLPWMQGGNLATRMRAETLAPARSIEIACALLGALGEAHRLGILHRDVKPSNVLFDAVGAPYLADFGAAHLSEGANTATAGAIGTFAYMSPEQRRGQPATSSSDLYAVGALLYELLTGEAAAPVAGTFVEAPPSAFHDELDARHDAVIGALLQEAPDDRPRDATTARRALEALTWPSRIEPHAPHSTRSSRPPEPLGARLEPPRDPGDGRDAGARLFDSLLGRHVLVLPLDDTTLALARRFAALRSPHVAGVLRLEGDEALWIEAPRGACLADLGVPLGDDAHAALAAELGRLHEAGTAHGAVDAEHVYLDAGSPFLAWPRREPAGASAREDLERLDALRSAARRPGVTES